MSERRRFVIESGEHLPDVLLRRARVDGPTRQARARALSRIVAAGAATSGVSVLAASLANKSATASIAKVSTFAVAKWVVIGATAATAVLGAREVAEHLTPPIELTGSAAARDSRAPAFRNGRQDPMGTPVASFAGAPPDTPAQGPLAVASPPPSWMVKQPDAPQPQEHALRPATPVPAVEIATAPPAGDATEKRAVDVASPQLSRELELLEKARAHLARRSGWAALDVLDTYRAAFPSGSMNIEAAVLQVEALGTVGRRPEAASLGQAFLAAHPHHPLAERVRAILAKLESPPPRP
jgi:hypothetical protein